MTQVLIRYRVRPDAVERHLELLAAVFAELAEARPPGVRWTSHQLDDGVTFVDVVSTEAPGTFSRLRTWPAYRRTLDERCDQRPVISELHPVGAYDGA